MIVLVAFTAPIHAVLTATLLLVCFDTLTGVIAARKKKQKISSRKFSRVLGKLLVYCTVICLAFIIQTLFAPAFPIQDMATSFIGLSEGMSILENLNIIYETDLVKKLIDAVKRKNDED